MNLLKLFQRLPKPLRRHKLLRLFALLSGGRVVLPIRVNGEFDALIDVRDAFARLIAIENEFESDFFRLAHAILPSNSAVFFDVGANYGLMSLGLSHQMRGGFTAHMFEANPYLCEIIQRSVKLNNAHGMRLINKAVMNKVSDVYLNFSLQHTGAGFITETGDGTAVRGITLDGYCKDLGIDRIDLLKVDVEGNESTVFLGASDLLSKQCVQAVYFEYAPAQLARCSVKKDPIAILQSHGYEVFSFRDAGCESTSKVTHHFKPDRRMGEDGVPLTLVHSGHKVKITDLIAFPGGRARRLAAD